MRYDNIIPFTYQRYAINIPSIYVRYTNKMTTNTLSVLYMHDEWLNLNQLKMKCFTLWRDGAFFLRQFHYFVMGGSLKIQMVLFELAYFQRKTSRGVGEPLWFYKKMRDFLKFSLLLYMYKENWHCPVTRMLLFFYIYRVYYRMLWIMLVQCTVLVIIR